MGEEIDPVETVEEESPAEDGIYIYIYYIFINFDILLSTYSRQFCLFYEFESVSQLIYFPTWLVFKVINQMELYMLFSPRTLIKV